MAYSEKVLDHYENPRNVGSFDKEEENVGTGMVGLLVVQALLHGPWKDPETGERNVGMYRVQVFEPKLNQRAMERLVLENTGPLAKLWIELKDN
mgnify:CR=1 FL=1